MKTIWNEKKVLITGGTSRLGKALTLLLTEKGAKVAVIARTPETLSALKKQNPSILTIKGDVSRKEAIYPLAGEILSLLGDPDVLIQCASTLGATPLRLFADTDCEDFQNVLETNLLGPFRLTKALLSSFILRDSGVIVNISSDAAVNAYPKWGAYSVSKAAVDHLTRIFHEELKETGVRFLAVDPGDMRTPMHFLANPAADPATLRDPYDSARSLIEMVEAEFSEKAVADVKTIRRSL